MKVTHVVCLALLITGFAAQSALAKDPVIDTSDPSQMTTDGLYPIKNTKIDVAFARSDLDLAPYKSIMVAPVSIAYQRKSYELTEKQADRMSEYFSDALVTQLEEAGYELTSEPGRDVLLVEANIIDLRINRDTTPSVGRKTVFTASSGEMTLIGELKDSMSGQILVRFADRQQPRSHWARATAVREWSEVRHAFRFWAEILTDRLDSFHGPVTQGG